MQDESVIPSVPEDFNFPAEVQYLNSTPTTETTIPNLGVDGSDTVFAPTIGTIQNFELMDLVQMFIVYAFIIAAAMAAFFIFMGGMSFILSGGDDEKIKRAVNTIRYAIIGLIVTILSFTVVHIVGRMFGLNFLGYLSYQKIKNSINQLISSVEKPPSSFEIEK